MESEETNKRKARLSARQLDILLSYMETNKDLREGKINPLLTKADRKRKWCELAEILNSEGRLFCSAVKTPDQWRKSWNDQKGYARNKASRIRTRSQNSPVSETLTPIEERILRIVGPTPAAEEPMETLNASAYSTLMEIPVIQDAIVIEQEAAVPIKEELHSDESNTIEAAAASEVSPQYGLSPGPSLPETNQSAFVAINLDQPSSQFATSQSGFVPLIFKPAETDTKMLPKVKNEKLTNARKQHLYRERRKLMNPEKEEENKIKDRERYHANKKLISELSEIQQKQRRKNVLERVRRFRENNERRMKLNQKLLRFPKMRKCIKKKREEKPVSSKELSAVLDNLKQQNDLLTRIATANEQIAQACMIIANNTEERTKETSLQTELIKDINQTLKYVLKQKSNGEFF